MERPVPCDPERPRVPGDRLAHDRRPHAGQLGEWDGVSTAAPAKLVLDLISETLHQATRPGVTASDSAGALGSASADVAVTTV